MPDPRKVYWDACNFLSYINGVPDRTPVLEELLRQSKAREIRIFTSTVSIVEVAFASQEQAGKALSDEQEQQIDDLWSDAEAIALVEFHAMIATEARRIIRVGLPKGWSLKAADAIHLATAKRVKVAEVHTYDDKLDRYADEIGIKICRPYTPQGVLDLPGKDSPPEPVS